MRAAASCSWLPSLRYVGSGAREEERFRWTVADSYCIWSNSHIIWEPSSLGERRCTEVAFASKHECFGALVQPPAARSDVQGGQVRVH